MWNFEYFEYNIIVRRLMKKSTNERPAFLLANRIQVCDREPALSNVSKKELSNPFFK